MQALTLLEIGQKRGMQASRLLKIQSHALMQASKLLKIGQPPLMQAPWLLEIEPRRQLPTSKLLKQGHFQRILKFFAILTGSMLKTG
jgi:hypothetical protein